MARSTKKLQEQTPEVAAAVEETKTTATEESSSNLIMSNPSQLVTVSREPVVVKSGRFTFVHH